MARQATTKWMNKPATVKGSQHYDPSTGIQALNLPFVKGTTIKLDFGMVIEIPGWGVIMMQPEAIDPMDMPPTINQK
jgi:hypothetical protein